MNQFVIRIILIVNSKNALRQMNKFYVDFDRANQRWKISSR